MRLTKRNADGIACSAKPFEISTFDMLDKLAAYEDTGYSPLEIKSLEGEWNAMRKVVDSYRKAEEQGRLVRLPEKLYGFYEWDVTGVRYYDGKVTAYCVKNEQVESIIYECEIGDSVFFTREEAEAAWNRRADDV